MLFNLTQSTPRLRVSEVIGKWRGGGYKEMVDGESVFYLLGRRYSSEELEKGEHCLDDEDMCVVSAVRGAAAEHGFTLSLGDLKHANCASPYEGECLDCYDCDVYHHEWDFGYDKKTQLLCAVDLHGKMVLPSEQVDGKLKGVYLEERYNFIPPNPFDKLEPDEGKESADSVSNRNFKWFRTTLVLNPDPDFEEIRYQDEGSYEFVMKYLKSFKERGITKADPRYSRWLHRAVKQTFYCSSEEVSVLYRFALEWEEPAVLCAILPSKFMRLDHGVETLSKPLEMFGFEQVRPGLDVTIARMDSLEQRVELLRAIAHQCSSSEEQGKAQLWSTNKTQEIFEKYANDRHGKVEDIPYISSLLRSDIWPVMQKSLIPRLLHRAQPIDFLISFINALEKLFQVLPMELLCDGEAGSTVGASQKLPLSCGITKGQTREAIDLLLCRLPYSWTDGKLVSPKPDALGPIKILRQLIPRPLAVPYCQHLFANILETIPFGECALPLRSDFYPSIIAEVATLLRKYNIYHHSSPFVEFLRHVIGTYMAEVHEDKASAGRPNTQLRKVGCKDSRCSTCPALNLFLNNPAKNSLQFDSVTVGNGAHIQNTFPANSKKKKLCDVTIDRLAPLRGRAQMVRVVVVKVDGLNDPPGWASRKDATKKFLANITTDDWMLKKIMGDTWDDFVLALEGTKKFPALKIGPAPTKQTNQKRPIDDVDSGAANVGQPDNKVRRHARVMSPSPLL